MNELSAGTIKTHLSISDILVHLLYIISIEDCKITLYLPQIIIANSIS